MGCKGRGQGRERLFGSLGLGTRTVVGFFVLQLYFDAYETLFSQKCLYGPPSTTPGGWWGLKRVVARGQGYFKPSF